MITQQGLEMPFFLSRVGVKFMRRKHGFCFLQKPEVHATWHFWRLWFHWIITIYVMVFSLSIYAIQKLLLYLGSRGIHFFAEITIKCYDIY